MFENVNYLENFRILKWLHLSKACCVFTLFLQTSAEYVKKYIERRYLMEKVCRWLVEKVVVRILCYGLALVRSEPVELKRQIFGKTQNLSIKELFF